MPNGLLIIEALLLVGLYLFRTRRLQDVETFAARAWLQTWTLAVYLVLAGYLAPRWWIGPSYDGALMVWLQGGSKSQK